MRFAWISVVSLGFALAASPAAASVRTYQVDANASSQIDLNLCGGRTRVEARGDGDTDVDFTIRDPGGAIVHQDMDSTDYTVKTIATGTTGCRTYTLRMRNVGDVYNNVTVTLTDLGGDAKAAAYNRRVMLVNNSAEAIHYLYASRTTTTRWEEDLLGAGVLMGNSSRNANIDDGSGACRFDFKARYRSGREVTRMDVNVCAVNSVSFR